MKAQKHSVVITVHVLSMDSVAALLQKVLHQIHGESTEDHIEMSDGDCVTWATSRQEVVF